MNGAMPCHALLVTFTNNWQNCHYSHEQKYVVKKCWVNNNKYLTDRSVIITPVLYTHLYFEPTYKGRVPTSQGVLKGDPDCSLEICVLIITVKTKFAKCHFEAD